MDRLETGLALPQGGAHMGSEVAGDARSPAATGATAIGARTGTGQVFMRNGASLHGPGRTSASSAGTLPEAFRSAVRRPLGAGLLAFALTLSTAAPCLAGAEHLSPEFRQQAVQACTGDALRLCPQSVLDEEAMAACMKVHRPQLSPGCRSVFDEGTRQRRP